MHKTWVPCYGSFETALLAFWSKRRHACQHFVEDASEGPPVTRLAIEVILGRCYNLRGQVFAGPAETARGAFARKNVFFR